jgi:hypothetical protein
MASLVGASSFLGHAGSSTTSLSHMERLCTRQVPARLSASKCVGHGMGGSAGRVIRDFPLAVKP